MLIDSHCHLNMAPLSEDLTGVLARALACDVKGIVAPAYDVGSWAQITGLATGQGSALPRVFPALGLHPWVANEIIQAGACPVDVPTPADLRRFRDLLAAALAAAPEAVAVGEIGLDTKVPVQPDQPAPTLACQQALLNLQLELAVELDLPVILHCRGAFEELLGALRPYVGRIRGVLHAFSRGGELAQRFIDLGLHIAFGGAVTRDRAVRARRAAATLPLDKVLLETDAPSIGLDGILPADTEPCHVRDIALALAGLRGETPATIAEVTTKNAQRLFGI